MVSFWPWRASTSSTDSFEKTLSTLSTRITETQTRLDKMRVSSRRVKLLWTLYLSFAYLVFVIVLLLVAGYKNLGAYEWTGVAGGPVLIFGGRSLVSTYFTYRIESLEARLKEQESERSKTIQKLKDATKYDSTLELIEKYGGKEESPKSEKNARGKSTGTSGEHGDHVDAKLALSRTGMPPPPTANIQRRDVSTESLSGASGPTNPETMEPGAEFAPNAFAQHGAPSHYQYNNLAAAESHWYDRVFDVLLGDDETAPKNRIVLICNSCRLVNGQAPPGTKSLADLGMWKCMSCQAVNGQVDEGKRIVQEVLAAQKGHEETDDRTETESEVEPTEVASPEESSRTVRKRRVKS